MKYKRRPKSAAVKDVDIVSIDIVKGDIDPSLPYTPSSVLQFSLYLR